MRTLLLVMSMIFTYSCHAQAVDSLGMDDHALLNNSEALYFNNLHIAGKPTGFDFQGKRIAFVTGSSCNKIIDKRQYFDSWGREYLITNTEVANNIVLLSESEKQLTGCDAILMTWCKVKLNNCQKLKLLNRIARQNNGN
jgi:hypothetical protein